MAYRIAPFPKTLNNLVGHLAAWNFSNSHTAGDIICIIYHMFACESESAHGL